MEGTNIQELEKHKKVFTKNVICVFFQRKLDKLSLQAVCFIIQGNLLNLLKERTGVFLRKIEIQTFILGRFFGPEPVYYFKKSDFPQINIISNHA